MPMDKNLKKIFLIGSGPIIIGQGCEFDYSGTQACKALQEEGCEVVLLNSNPATIMTDPNMAHATYIAPMTIETCIEIIKKERPDALLPTLGGQTALNLAVELSKLGILEKYHVKLIGADVDSIEKAESRKFFREAMAKIGLGTPRAFTVANKEQVSDVLKHLSFPLIIRTSFTLGGLGSGIVYTEEELSQKCQDLFANPHFQAIEIEESLIGWKEFEMEAIRDRADNCIIVCSLENVDPMGVHTGDSITVAPAMTLCNKEYQRMRQATFDILREIGVNTGGANVQFAIHPDTGRMLVIEMNPRVSRSSALASKATGYPIAKIATKLALGYTLDELENTLTATPASFEPTIDYVVTKLPRFNFEKFPHCDGILTTKMQATGEVIGLGRNFQESLQKALCSLEKDLSGLTRKKIKKELLNVRLKKPYFDRLFYLTEALREGYSIEELYQWTYVDRWFLEQIADLVHSEQIITHKKITEISKNEWRRFKRQGFSDAYLAELLQSNETEIRRVRQDQNVLPVYKRVDTCAAEFPTQTACLYSTYEYECESKPTNRKKVMIIGSGPNRIGQGIEFDYGSVHAALTARELGFETIMVNSNPETVSTDYDIVDRLYLEPLTLEHVLNIIELEKPDYVVTQFGGQTALNLVVGLDKAGVPLLGTDAQAIDVCENRNLFKQMIVQFGFRQPKNFCIEAPEIWQSYADKVEYPVILRPSYLLSGSSMKIIRNAAEFNDYFQLASLDKKYFPILVEEFLIDAVEVEVDGICDGETVFIPGVMEQLELAGIHSGDSTCYFPPKNLVKELQDEIITQAKQLALLFRIRGLFNIQFAVKEGAIYIIEINPRSSRTVPYLSKALGMSLPKIAMQCLLGQGLQSQGYELPIYRDFISVKIPVFPFDRLGRVELGPEMRSTGEMMVVQKDFEKITVTCLQEIS